MLWLCRSPVSTQEPVERRGYAYPAGAAHGLAVLPGSSVVHNIEDTGTILRPGAHKIA